MTPRLKQRYDEVLKKELTETFGYKTAMQVPRLDKIGLNMAVGKAVAQRAVEAGIKEVAFDRSGYQYHGRVKELADAAREVGLSF